MSDPYLPKPVRPGTWRVRLEIHGPTGSARTPCCTARVAVGLAELDVLGAVSLRCPDCGKRWELRHDPWKPGTDALWID